MTGTTPTADRAAWRIGQRVSRRRGQELGTITEINGKVKVKWDGGRKAFLGPMTRARHVRFTPESGHGSVVLECPLCAKSCREVPGGTLRPSVPAVLKSCQILAINLKTSIQSPRLALITADFRCLFHS
jgi:hypothetical protein